MIRLFTVFCKLNLKTLSVKDLFLESMKDFSSDKLPFIKLGCPCCGAKTPIWSYHDSYPRYLISFENELTITYTIDITRIICSSCQHAHAILPEIIIPYSSYSLPFILNVLKDYFLSKMTVKTICEKYQTSVSMLYGWKRLFLTHKKLWLGILENMYQNSIAFLSSIPTFNTSNDLSLFFLHNGHSFLQGIHTTAHFSSA
jgi:hypothetical protein